MPGRGRPEIIGGPRSPQEAAQRERAEKAKAGMLDTALEALQALKGDPVPARPAGVREFGSAFRNFRLTIERSEAREVNGITIPAKLQTLQWDNGLLRTSDPIVITAIESHKNYGRDIWDADEVLAKAERAAAENFLVHVDTLPPDIKEQLRVKLGMDDFSLPAVPPA